MRCVATAGLLAAWLTAQVAAQVAARVDGGGAARVEVAGVTHALAALPVDVPAGRTDLHFAANADGKPASLTVSTSPGDRLGVASERSGPAVLRMFAADELRAAPPLARGRDQEPWQPLVASSGEDESSYRVVAKVACDPTAEPFALVARHSDNGDCYLLVIEPVGSRFRFERRFGGHRMTMASGELILRGPQVEVALEVRGFRLQAWVDGERILQQLDGGVRRGGFGAAFVADPASTASTAAAGAAARLASLGIGDPLDDLASAAVVCGDGTATVHAAVFVQPGSFHRLELTSAWPAPAVPISDHGFEPWVLQRDARPRFSIDLRWGEVPPDGRIEAALQWPSGAALALQSVGLQLVLVAPNGDWVLDRTPALRLGF